MLVSIDDLAAHLDDQDQVIVDCRFNLQQPEAGPRLYAEGHIPGAFYADLDRDLSGPKLPGLGRHPLPDVTGLQKLLSGFGIGPESRVVVYDEGGGAMAARLWWLLRHFGHFLLHAGLVIGQHHANQTGRRLQGQSHIVRRRQSL